MMDLQYVDRGSQLVTENKLDDAEAHFYAALCINQTCLPAALNLAALHLLKKEAHATRIWLQIASTMNQNNDLQFQLVTLLLQLSDLMRRKELFADSHKVIEMAVTKATYLQTIFPERIESYGLLGTIKRLTGNFAESIECFEKANQLGGNCNLGIAESLRDIGQYQASLNLYEECGETIGKATALACMDRYEEAIQVTSDFIEKNPTNHDAYMNRALFKLMCNQWESGWIDYESRFNVYIDYPNLKPRWTGENLFGKTIVVSTEQGYGDSFMGARYLHRIQAEKKILRIQPALVEFFKYNFPDWQLISWGEPIPTFDYFIPLLSLPALFNKGEPIPNVKMDASYEMLNKYLKRLDGIKKKKIGICWHGGNYNANDFLRTIKAEDFSPLMLPDVQLFSLQQNAINIPGVIQYDLETWEDTAGLISNLDLVISVDTSICHLAGSLKVKTWIALPYVREWRWGRSGETTAWYDSARLWTCAAPGQWRQVFQAMAESLKIV